jgi:hypothetical protein
MEDEMGEACSTLERRNEYKISVGKPDCKNHSEDLDVDVKIILGCILGK